MSTRNTAPEPRHDTTTDRPGPFSRVTNTLAWYSPELTVAAASAGAAATVWAPLGAISVALGGWIAADQVNIARANRRVRRQITEQRTERAQPGPGGEHDEPAESSDDIPHDGAETGDASSAGDSTSDERAAERPGWEVAG